MTTKFLPSKTLQKQHCRHFDSQIKVSSGLKLKKIAACLLMLLLSCGFLVFGGRAIWAGIESLSSGSSTDDLSGITNLMTAVSNRDIEAIKYYTKSIASEVNKKNYGGATALHLACRNSDIEIARLLLENGAEVNVADNEGWTPLMRAALASNFEIVELLLNRGATVEDLNAHGEIAVFHATSSGCGDCVVAILRKMPISKVIESEDIRNQMVEAYEIATQTENIKASKAIADFNNQLLKFTPFSADTKQTSDENDDELSTVSKDGGETQVYEIENPISKKGAVLRNLSKSRTPKKYRLSEESKDSELTPSPKRLPEKYLPSLGKEFHESVSNGDTKDLGGYNKDSDEESNGFKNGDEVLLNELENLKNDPSLSNRNRPSYSFISGNSDSFTKKIFVFKSDELDANHGKDLSKQNIPILKKYKFLSQGRTTKVKNNTSQTKTSTADNEVKNSASIDSSNSNNAADPTKSSTLSTIKIKPQPKSLQESDKNPTKSEK